MLHVFDRLPSALQVVGLDLQAGFDEQQVGGSIAADCFGAGVELGQSLVDLVLLHFQAGRALVDAGVFGMQFLGGRYILSCLVEIFVLGGRVGGEQQDIGIIRL